MMNLIMICLQAETFDFKNTVVMAPETSIVSRPTRHLPFSCTNVGTNRVISQAYNIHVQADSETGHGGRWVRDHLTEAYRCPGSARIVTVASS